MNTDFDYCPKCGCHDFAASSEKSRRCKRCGFEFFLNASAAYVALITNSQGQLLVVRRRKEPAIGTLDLPGGFADAGETAEEGIAREVREETGLTVVSAKYLFSKPNIYVYSGMKIPTLDMFFQCEVEQGAEPKAMDDAAECMWIAIDELDPTLFGLSSISEGIKKIKTIF